MIKFSEFTPLFLLATVVGGCSTNRLHNLSAIGPIAGIQIKRIEASPGFDPKSVRKFYLRYDPKETDGNSSIVRKQLDYSIDRILGFIGLERSDSITTDAVVIDAIATNNALEHYVPPRTDYLPLYMPGATTTTLAPQTGSFSAGPLLGGINNQITGTYSGSSLVTTTAPGYTMNMPIHKQGYTVQSNRTSLFLSVSKNDELKWIGEVDAAFSTPDVRINSQSLLIYLLTEQLFKGGPPGDSDGNKEFDNLYTFGAATIYLTTNGNDYYPVIQRVFDKDLESAGLENLDVILSINGKSVKNLSRKDFRNEVLNTNNDKMRLEIKRLDQTIYVDAPVKTIRQFK